MITVKGLDKNTIGDFAKYIPLKYLQPDEEGEDVVFYGVLNDDAEIGAIVLSDGYYNIELKFIVLDESIRGMGYGYDTINHLKHYLKRRGYERFYCSYIPKLNPQIDRIVEAIGCEKAILPVGYIEFPVSEVRYFCVEKGKPLAGMALSDLNNKKIDMVCKYLDKVGYSHLKTGIRSREYEMELSRAAFKEDGTGKIIGVESIVLVDKESDSKFYMAFLYNNKNPGNLIRIIRSVVSTCVEKYGDDINISMISGDERITDYFIAKKWGDISPKVEAAISFREEADQEEVNQEEVDQEEVDQENVYQESADQAL